VIKDIKENGYCFTDGCGLISLGLAHEVAEKIGIPIKQLVMKLKSQLIWNSNLAFCLERHSICLSDTYSWMQRNIDDRSGIKMYRLLYQTAGKYGEISESRLDIGCPRLFTTKLISAVPNSYEK
jgi:hypothetical protein